MYQRFVIWGLLGWALSGFAHNAEYYQLNPKELSKAIATCPEHAPKDVSCDELKALAIRVNTLADELRYDPQAFGQKIIQLQETLDKNTSHARARQALKERMAIVKWLESPEN